MKLNSTREQICILETVGRSENDGWLQQVLKMTPPVPPHMAKRYLSKSSLIHSMCLQMLQ